METTAISKSESTTKENPYESRIYPQRTCRHRPLQPGAGSGQYGIRVRSDPGRPATGKMADTVEEQAAQSLANLKAILAEAGLTMANVVKTVIFLADINDFAAVNAEYAKAFAEPFPARSCVQVAAIPKGAKLEIECIAVRD